MAIALNQRNGSDLLEVVVSGKITHEDFEQFGPKVEEMVKQHGSIRVLFDMVAFHGWEPNAVWDDTKFALKHFCDISRIAMVGDKSWEHGMSTLCRPFTKAEIRYFDWSAIREAWAWLDLPRKETLMHAAMADVP